MVAAGLVEALSAKLGVPLATVGTLKGAELEGCTYRCGGRVCAVCASYSSKGSAAIKGCSACALLRALFFSRHFCISITWHAQLQRFLAMVAVASAACTAIT